MKQLASTLTIIGLGVYASATWAAPPGSPVHLAQQSVTTQSGHTVDMQAREPHKKEHEQGQKAAGPEGKPVTTQSGHTAQMPGRESHKKEHGAPKAAKAEGAAAAGAPVTSSEHTSAMPGRESHKKEHEKK